MSDAFYVRINTQPETVADRLRELAETGIYRGIAQAVADIKPVVSDALQSETPVKTGYLRDSEDVKQYAGYDGSVTLAWKTDAPYAYYVISGTRPHDIYPVNAKALAFYSRTGELVFATHVRHPGTRPNPFPERSWDKARDDVFDIFREMGKQILSAVTG